jgi:hypothetical protein
MGRDEKRRDEGKVMRIEGRREKKMGGRRENERKEVDEFSDESIR